MLITLLLALATLATTPATDVSRPTEDDARVGAVLTVASVLGASDRLVYESGRSTVYAGVVLDNECSLGAYWLKSTRDWTAIEVECP